MKSQHDTWYFRVIWFWSTTISWMSVDHSWHQTWIDGKMASLISIQTIQLWLIRRKTRRRRISISVNKSGTTVISEGLKRPFRNSCKTVWKHKAGLHIFLYNIFTCWSPKTKKVAISNWISFVLSTNACLDSGFCLSQLTIRCIKTSTEKTPTISFKASAVVSQYSKECNKVSRIIKGI